MNGITEDKLKGMREYKNAYYQGCAFSLFLLSVVMIGICGVLHGFESQICLFMIACTGVEGALLAQDKWRNKLVNILCKLLYLMVFPVMMVIFVCYELNIRNMTFSCHILQWEFDGCSDHWNGGIFLL